MPISNQDAVKFGLLVMYAEDMYVKGKLQPAPEPRIADAGWDVINHIIATDSIIPPLGSARKTLELGQTVFYGFLARNKADPSRYMVAVRGTAGLAEWIIDAQFMQIPYPHLAGAMVEQGFWGIYSSMKLAALDGTPLPGTAAKAIAQTIGAGQVTVCGHSLGSALATYLSLDLARGVGTQASAVMFASPRAGNPAFAGFYHQMLGDRYFLYNYVLDVVPYVPLDLPGMDYATLPNATVIQPGTAQADVEVGLGCDHHLICYCAMLDYEFTKHTPMTPQDKGLYACVLDPNRLSLNDIKARALAIAAKELSRAEMVRDLAKLKRSQRIA